VFRPLTLLPSSHPHLLIERRSYDAAEDPAYVTEMVKETASILASSSPTVTGILRCIGWVHNHPLHAFDLYLSIPPTLCHATPRSLRSILTTSGAPRHSLSARLAVAKKLAAAVFYMHLSRFVHKNIRPETILLFTPGTYPDELGPPFLVGFEQARQMWPDVASRLRGTVDAERAVYLHPSRHGTCASDTYTVRHDMFSLGVVLIELALWKSFVLYPLDEPGTTELNREIFRSGARAMFTKEEKSNDHGQKIVRFLVDLTRKNVPRVMGNRYANVVVTCLEMPQVEAEEDGDCELNLAVKYIETVLEDLEEIML
jgi:hypothetical protein